MKKTLLSTIFLKVTHILTEETLLKNTDVDSLRSQPPTCHQCRCERGNRDLKKSGLTIHYEDPIV